MARLPEIWGDDALEFQPHRFLKDPNPSPYKHAVFNAGPRLCLGQRMAVIEATLAIAMIVNEFDVKVVDDHVSYTNALTLPIKNGLMVRIHNRQ